MVPRNGPKMVRTLDSSDKLKVVHHPDFTLPEEFGPFQAIYHNMQTGCFFGRWNLKVPGVSIESSSKEINSKNCSPGRVKWESLHN